MTNPSGDPRLDPDFQRRHSFRADGKMAVPLGKSTPIRTYRFGLAAISTKSQSRYLVIGRGVDRLYIIRRSNRYRNIVDFMVNLHLASGWAWVRAVDQRTGEILYLKDGDTDLSRWEE